MGWKCSIEKSMIHWFNPNTFSELPMPREISGIPLVRAPDFPANLDWIHISNRSLSLTDLRGKIVLLDFWTYG